MYLHTFGKLKKSLIDVKIIFMYTFPYSNDHRSDVCKTFNWLYESEFAQWSLSPSSNWHSNVISISFNSHIDRSQVRAYKAGIRPTLYLDSGIKYVSGSGKKKNPFIIK